ncbi:hypothetical protein P167DRAFT_593837 [Morchella conica CCBAS932]|uniref:Uncharacterized protein n=1 Tax=Morchella conica CCBAS932 TaxID=1392247 RepID=A0A3N4KJK4_9PEZI|nr:hypothetical protein P167DRAFT_593837 [Morchella conica CCBAS932]
MAGMAPIPVVPSVAAPGVATPRVATPHIYVATPRVATPRVATPRVATPRVATPPAVAPQPVSSEAAILTVVTQETAALEEETSKVITPRTESSGDETEATDATEGTEATEVELAALETETTKVELPTLETETNKVGLPIQEAKAPKAEIPEVETIEVTAATEPIPVESPMDGIENPETDDSAVTYREEFWAFQDWDDIEEELAQISGTCRAQIDANKARYLPTLPVKKEPQGTKLVIHKEPVEFKPSSKVQAGLGAMYNKLRGPPKRTQYGPPQPFQPARHLQNPRPPYHQPPPPPQFPPYTQYHQPSPTQYPPYPPYPQVPNPQAFSPQVPNPQYPQQMPYPPQTPQGWGDPRQAQLAMINRQHIGARVGSQAQIPPSIAPPPPPPPPTFFTPQQANIQFPMLPEVGKNHTRQENLPPIIHPPMYNLPQMNNYVELPSNSVVTMFDFWLGDPFDPPMIGGAWERLTIAAPGEMRLSTLFEDYYAKSGFNITAQKRTVQDLNFYRINIKPNGQVRMGEVYNYDAVLHCGDMLHDTAWFTWQRVILVGGDRMGAFQSTYGNLLMPEDQPPSGPGAS